MAELQLIQDPSGVQSVATGLTGVSATGAGSAIPMAGLLSITFDVSGITTATVTFQGSCDGGTTWHNALGTSSASVNIANVTADGLWALLPQFVFTHIRANVTAWTAGTITVKALTRVR